MGLVELPLHLPKGFDTLTAVLDQEAAVSFTSSTASASAFSV